ncbi:hypothetical protein J056_000074 [Wallemia ichthyophaga EXF-994]|uniref:Zn(2)-C6 fungal-type domain-containing protein n=1 Tax=Wallemia ichthyophaga (strain EXF-994 / CBS 113033) TaxID=1299270 RepID=R9AR95_WALI9|nr:uncharacterized protein J056_000074 [Wallemia ichthyophaga EXF-994]TIB02331.1 hypothetical protein E3P95_00929 [Wallemia ichthyophaga]EOR04737.1 hypothetical protein J056_000074 [Wallemia ichthyophaga EXF-994]TIB03286.1 hypothetical protein E3P94_01061 [Wallemia ichthyophaga]TIB36664.1 hypothetical protein E3P84_00810 [Wallemia ichthyophaga]TIB43038.1 hypothetical protein E3P83_00883 [Wallemia ichthyophaga]
MAIYACRPCQISHSSCDNYRPCHNCSRKDIEESCITVEHRRRGRPGKHDKMQSTPLFSHRPFPEGEAGVEMGATAGAEAKANAEAEAEAEARSRSRARAKASSSSGPPGPPAAPHNINNVTESPLLVQSVQPPHNQHNTIRMVVTPDLSTTMDITQNAYNAFFACPSTRLPSLQDITSVFHTPRLANLQAKLALDDALPVEKINVVDIHGQYFASTLSIRWLEKGRSVLAELYVSHQVNAVPTLPSPLPPMMGKEGSGSGSNITGSGSGISNSKSSVLSTSNTSQSDLYLSRSHSQSSTLSNAPTRPAHPQRIRTSINALCDL